MPLIRVDAFEGRSDVDRAAAAFDVKDCPEIKRRPRRDARRAKENPGVWDWKLRNKDHAAPITDKITI